jgi:aerotaxis receptor
MIEQISHGAGEQLTGIDQVNSSVTHIDSLTQQNAAMVEQMAAAAKQLQQLSVTVAETVQVFRLEGDRSARQPDAVALRRAARETASG